VVNWEHVGYALLCVAVPVIWGLIVFWLANHIEKRVLERGHRRGQDDRSATMPPLDYHI